MKKIILIIVAVLVVSLGGFLFMMSGKKEKDRSFSYDPGEYFVTDIHTSTRLLKADFMIEMADIRKKEYYVENNHRIRDVVIRTIRGKTETELQSSDIQDSISDAIVAGLNTEFETTDFIKIYFNEFVIQ